MAHIHFPLSYLTYDRPLRDGANRIYWALQCVVAGNRKECHVYRQPPGPGPEVMVTAADEVYVVRDMWGEPQFYVHTDGLAYVVGDTRAVDGAKKKAIVSGPIPGFVKLP